MRNLITLSISYFFKQLGYFIADYYKACLVIPILLVFVAAIGVKNLEEVSSVRDYFISDTSPSKYEYNVAKSFFDDQGQPYMLLVALEAADRGDLLRQKNLDRALEIENFLQYNLTVEHDGKNYSYSDFCGNHCQASDLVNTFLLMYKSAKYGNNTHVKMSYPSMDLFGHHVYLANNILRVSLRKNSIIQESRLILIHFRATFNSHKMLKVLEKWEKAVLAFTMKTRNESLVRAYAASEGLLAIEFQKTSHKAMPLFTLSYFAILVFTVVTCFNFDRVKSKHCEAFFGVLCPVLSLCTSFGFLFWIGSKWMSIVTVVPFLILAIGVDDACIFLHAWQLSVDQKSPRDRLGHAMAEAGPAMTITSLTNFISFTVGMFSSTPAIRAFCMFTTIAVLFDYLYQIFFFTSIVYIGGLKETQRSRTHDLVESEKPPPNSLVYELASRFKNVSFEFILDFWIKLAMNKLVKLIVGSLLLTYWATAIYGLIKMQVGLKSENLFLEDSPLMDFLRILSSVIFVESGQDRQLIDFQYKYMPEFLENLEYSHWKYYLHMGDLEACKDEKPECIKKFIITTGFRGAVSWSKRLEMLQDWRSVANEYKDLNVTLYEDFSIYADQLLTIPPSTYQTVTCAILSMAAVLCVFTPKLKIVIPGVCCVISINLGVFGFLYYWDIDMDPISMAAILMAIGYSVDSIAHITFHYFKTEENQDMKDQMKQALSSIAWPLIQANVSTILGVLTLVIIKSYMVQVFIKVAVLVVILGLIHAIVILPVVFAMIPIKK